MINARLSLFVFISIALYSCSKKPDIAPNQTTTVSGRFYDWINQVAYPNVKVRIAEFQGFQKLFQPPGETPVALLDSTTTDANGYYKLTFTTNGKGSDYYVEYKGLPANVEAYGNAGPQYWVAFQKIYDFGKTDVYNPTVLRLYLMKIHVIVHNDPYPPLMVRAANDSVSGALGDFIHGTNNDTTEYIQVFKNKGGFRLYFSVFNPKTNLYYGDTSATINPPITDTVQGGTYNVYPATFK